MSLSGIDSCNIIAYYRVINIMWYDVKLRDEDIISCIFHKYYVIWC